MTAHYARAGGAPEPLQFGVAVLLDAAQVVSDYETCLTALVVLVVLWLRGASTLQEGEDLRRAASARDPEQRQGSR